MFTWNAQDYSRNSAGQEVWARELLALAGLRPDDAVLDVGCGDGRTTAAIAARVPHGSVVGVDLSPDMIRHAREQHCGAHRNLDFAQADAEKLPFADEFSLVFSNATLHWVPDQRAAVLGIARALRGGGRLIAQMGGSQGKSGAAPAVTAAFDAVAATPRWRSLLGPFVQTYYFQEPSDYEPWLAEAGFDIHECRLIPKEMMHADLPAFSGWLRTAWHPYTSRVAPELRDALLEDVIARYLTVRPPDANDQITVSMLRLQVRATKNGSIRVPQ